MWGEEGEPDGQEARGREGASQPASLPATWPTAWLVRKRDKNTQRDPLPPTLEFSPAQYSCQHKEARHQ
eukprot:12205331-Prorocentrum_lima.AAC.1